MKTLLLDSLLPKAVMARGIKSVSKAAQGNKSVQRGVKGFVGRSNLLTTKIMKAPHMTVTTQLCKMKKTVMDLIVNVNLILLMMSMDLIILNVIMILTTRMRDHATTTTDLVTIHLFILVERGVMRPLMHKWKI
jgi:hypothetical protein